MVSRRPAGEAIAGMDPVVPPLRDMNYLAGLISEITSLGVEEVTRRLVQEHRRPCSAVCEAVEKAQIEPYVWNDRLTGFYAQTDAFLYETAVWNRHPAKNQVRSWIGELLARRHPGPVRVLAYGDGLGFDSLYFRQLGHTVSYFEVSQACRRFAERIFRDNGVDVEILSAPHQIEPESYDVVTCLDVLEHVPAPAELIEQMARALRPAGLLMIGAPFWLVGRGWPTHLAANRRFSGRLAQLCAPYSLRPVDARPLGDPLVLQRSAGPLAVGLAARFRIARAALILTAARYWPLPFIALTRFLLRSGSRKLLDGFQGQAPAGCNALPSVPETKSFRFPSPGPRRTTGPNCALRCRTTGHGRHP
jgi:SAM-dependent methyltransferase